MNSKLLALFGFSMAMFYFGIEALLNSLHKVAAIEFSISITTMLLFMYFKRTTRNRIA